MKLMIASDIHGSALYCRQMLEAYRREGADRLLLLGDLLYHGPRNDLPEEYAPKEVIALLAPLKQELLSRGDAVKVLSPQSLRDEMQAEIINMYNLYRCGV